MLVIHRRTHSESELAIIRRFNDTNTLIGTTTVNKPPTKSELEQWRPESYLDPNGRLTTLKQNTELESFNSHNGYINVMNNFKRQQEVIVAEKAELMRQLDSLRYQLNRAKQEKDEAYKELQKQAHHVARILDSDRPKTSTIESEKQTELQFLMQREINANLTLKEQLHQTQQRIQILDTYTKQQIISIKERDNIIQHQQSIIDTAREHENSLLSDIRKRDLTIDELKVLNIKMEKKMKCAMSKEDIESRDQLMKLEASENQARNESKQLRTALDDLITSTEVVHTQFEELKRITEVRKEQYIQLSQEIEEARNLYGVLMSQKKQLQSDIAVMIKQRNEAVDKYRLLELTLAKKEREITELLEKVNETVRDYESKLEKKDEQMWAITEKLNEESSINKMNMNIMEKEKIMEMERKLQAQAQTFTTELEKIRNKLEETEDELKKQTNKLIELNNLQYEPRMERLRAIEKDLKLRMEEYLLAEESLETGLICPKCLQFFRQPYSLIPCQHSYCNDCIIQIKSENYDCIICPECGGGGGGHTGIDSVQHIFRNDALDSLTERFTRRKSLVMSMMSWIKVLRIFEPATQQQQQQQQQNKLSL